MYIVIVNPEAGNGKALTLFHQIQTDRLFKSENCRSFKTEYAGHAEKIAAQISEIHHEIITCIIIIGGDGTLHEVLNGLQSYPSIPIAVIPAGSGNDFARGVGYNKKGVELFRKIVTKPNQMNVRTGVFITNQRHKYGRRLFANSIGFGLDGQIVAFSNQSNYRKWMKRLHLRSLHYVIGLLTVISRIEPMVFELNIDGRKSVFEKAVMVTVTNHPYYGGGMKISPGAHIKKPTFKIMVIRPIAKWKILALFLTVFIGKHTKFKEVIELEGKSIQIKSKTNLPYQTDGEFGVCKECIIRKSDNSPRIFYG